MAGEFGDLLNLDAGYDPTGGALGDWWGLFNGGDMGGLAAGFPTTNAGEQLYFDTQTGQLVTLAQAQAIDPTFQGAGSGGNAQPAPGGYTGGSVNYTGSPADNVQQQLSPQQTSLLSQALGVAPGVITALAGLGMLGGAASALFGSGNKPGTATTTSTTQSNALTSPAVQGLLGSAGSGAGGSYAGGGGLLGAAGQGAANLQGAGGLLQQQIGAIPQLNPAIQAAIGQNALGFSQGNVPTLNSPQAQQYFQNVLGGQNASVDYNTGNALTDAIQNLRARGFAGGSEIFREGAPAAAMGPILAQANAQKAMNLGNINAQQLQYATQLPQLGAQLNAAQLGAQAVPFGAYTTAAQTQAGLPLDLMRALMSSSGSTTSSSAQGAQPNLVQTLGQITPLLGAAGGAFSSPAVAGGTGTPSLYAQLSGLFG